MHISRITISLLALIIVALMGCSAPQHAGLEQTVVPDLQSSEATGWASNQADSAAETIQLKYAFDSSNEGWRTSAANFPQAMDANIDFNGGRSQVPRELGNGYALELRGTNEPVTLFMYASRELQAEDGIEPNRTYLIHARTSLISGASSECIGMGGSPGAMTVQVGAFGKSSARYQDENGVWRLPADPYSDSGFYTSVGSNDNGKPCEPSLSDYARVSRTSRAPLKVKADASGRLSVVIGVRGGFTGETRLWLETIELRVQPI